MRNVCHVDVLVGPRDKLIPPLDVARWLFEELKGCRPLTVATDGARFSIKVLLPELPDGYANDRFLTSMINLGISGKGSVLTAVHSVREATAVEILDRGLSLARRR